MTDTPRPTPADVQTWRREAQDYLDGGRHTGTAPRMAPRILALLDALTAAEQASDDKAQRVGAFADERIAALIEANGREIERLRAALTAKDEALAYWQTCVNCHEPMEEPGHCSKATLENTEGWMEEIAKAEAESARLKAQVEALREERDSWRRVAETCKRESNAADAQVTRLTEAIGKAEAQLVQPWDQNYWITAARDILRAALAPATPPVYERCVCGHPGDTPTCPIDHDQIQHEQDTPPDIETEEK